MGSLQLELVERRVLMAGMGVQSSYFNDTNFGGTSVSRIDSAINFNWGTISPAPSIAPDMFSARYTARLKSQTNETYRLYIVTESPVRLWVSNHLVIDAWKSVPAPKSYKGSVRFSANARYDVMIELLHDVGRASLKFQWQTDTLNKQTVPGQLLSPSAPTLQTKINHALAFARDRVAETLKTFPTPANGYPDQTMSNGQWKLAPATNWTSGFFAGEMSQLNLAFPGAAWDTNVRTWTTPLAAQRAQPGDHFSRLWNTFKPLFDETGNPTYRQVLLDAAASKDAQFNAAIGAFRTPELVSNSGNPQATFGVLIDQTLDLDLMFWASDQTGNQTFRRHAIKHLETVIARMIRADGSVFQRFFFNRATGAPIGGENFQGSSNTSTWSRGQAWAIYGISRIAELTGRADFLAAAKKVARYYIDHLPADFVPYWDFQAPGIPSTYRDSSAAAIAARGLLRLGRISMDATFTNAAENILGSLLSPKYLAEGTSNRAILQHAALHVPGNRAVNNGLIFADYYLLEAMNAYMNRG